MGKNNEGKNSQIGSVVFGLSLLALAFLLGLWGAKAFAASGKPQDIQDMEKVFENGGWENYQGKYVGKIYNPPSFPNATPPVRFILPKAGNKLKLTVDLQGFPGLSGCETDSGGTVGRLVIRPCSSMKSGKVPGMIVWGSVYEGTNSMGWRIVTAIKKAQATWPDRIDLDAGIDIRGTSMGGTGCIKQSRMLPDPKIREQLVTCDALVPFTNFITSQYERDPAVKKAWGSFPTWLANIPFAMKQGVLNDVTYLIKGATNDSLGEVEPRFFKDCDRFLISCYGVWDKGGHSHTGEPGVNLPRPSQQSRLDQPLVIFTQSSQNHWGERGHYNLGLSYSNQPNAVTLSYKAHKGIGGGIPDQADTVTVNVTLRRAGPNDIDLGKITLQSGKPKSVAIQSVENPPSTKYKYGYLFTRQPRAGHAFGEWEDQSAFQGAVDTGRVNGKITESDLVYQDLDGKHHVLHDCTSDDKTICSAGSGRFTHDTKYAIYEVKHGSRFTPVTTNAGPKTDLVEFGVDYSELWIVNVDTKQKKRLTTGHNDRTPVHAVGNKYAFVSDRAGVYPPLAYNGPAYPFKSLQLHTLILAGDNITNFTATKIKNIGVHHQMCLNPSMATNGDILVSCWNGYKDRGKGLTPVNMWWAERIGQHGQNNRVILGAHGTGTIKTRQLLTNISGGIGSENFLSLRPVAEIKKDKLASGSYYRSNWSPGIGLIYTWTSSLVEGSLYSQNIPSVIYKNMTPGSGRYVPKTLIAATAYGSGQDAEYPRMHDDGRAVGRAGEPAACAGNDCKYLFTHSRGHPYAAGRPGVLNSKSLGGEPAAKREIRKALVDQILDPFDPTQSVVVACPGLDFHCWDGQQRSTYQEKFGQPEPATQEMPRGYVTRLRVVDSKAGELDEIPHQEAHKIEQSKITFQGNADKDWQETIKKFRVGIIEPWKSVPTRQGFKSVSYIDTLIESDGSLEAVIPCGVSYIISGVNAQGENVATDNYIHPAVCGETKTCHGCHDAHSEERADELKPLGTPEQRFIKTIAGKKTAQTGASQ